MPSRILINGATGKMGKEAIKAIGANPEFIIVAELNRKHSLQEEIKKHQVNVVLDLTTASVVKQNLITILEAGVHPVIGTSGLTQADVEEISLRFKDAKIGGIIAPNFSLGAVLMMKYAAEAARYFSEVEIIEMHHAGKLDSPSGTAIRTAEMLAANKSQQNTIKTNTKEVIPGARGAAHHDIPIHSIRLPGVIAAQQIIFGSVGETLSFQHTASERSCFMPGVVLACRKVVTLDKIIYGLENIL